MLIAGLSGIWVLVVAVGAMAAGGYVAGRMRGTWHVAHTDEVEFRDGVHGLVVWALAVSFGALLSAVAATALIAGAAAGSAAGGGTVGGSGAASPVAYELDRLLWSAEGPVASPPYVREEAGRLLTAAVSEPSFRPDDRARLAGLVAATAHLTPDAAQARVGQSIADVRAKVRAARHAAIILAFTTAASLLAAAAAAWQASCVGGRHRDNAAPPSLAAWRRRQLADSATIASAPKS